MKRLLAYLFLVFFFITPSFSADEFTKRLDKLTKQLDATKEMYDDGVLSEEDYEKTKNILLDKVDTTKKAVKEKKVTEEKKKAEISKKVAKQLDTIKEMYDDGVLSEEDYEKTKNILLDKVDTTKKAVKEKKVTEEKELNEILSNQLNVIAKLYDDGMLSEEEYKATKNILLDKAETVIKEQLAKGTLIRPKISIEKRGNEFYEKAELIYGNYKIYTHRPGGIKIRRITDNKTMVVISDQLKTKYYNEGKSIFDINVTKEKSKSSNKNEYKLELKKDGIKLLHWESRYIPKHRTFFYQVLTGNYVPFHFYVKLPAKNAHALNISMFNKKISRAMKKAKKKLAVEYNMTPEEIDKIMKKRTEEKVSEKSAKIAVQKSVEEAIEKSVGKEFAKTLEDATESAAEKVVEETVSTTVSEALSTAIDKTLSSTAVKTNFDQVRSMENLD